MEHIKVYLLDSNAEVQYGLNWGQRENRDKNQAYLQLLPEVYKSDFFPKAGKYFIIKTDDEKILIFNRAQKGIGTALQTPESNAIIGLYIRARMGVLPESEITREDIMEYGKLDIDFYKTNEDLTYLMVFNKEWKSLDIEYIFIQYLLISNKCKNWQETKEHINSLNIVSEKISEISNKKVRLFQFNSINNLNSFINDFKVSLEGGESNTILSGYKEFLQSEYFILHYGKDQFSYKNKNRMNNNLQSLQQIFYGAPGTGKSHKANEVAKSFSAIRTTFHPDSDYSTFVGAYKPTSKKENRYGLNGSTTVALSYPDGPSEGLPINDSKIEYRFVKQAFLKAYIKAWKFLSESENLENIKPQFLIIEEINRGNCAQIFGDLFQLLDRKNGFSEYPIDADEDIRKSLICKDTELDPSFGENGLQLSEGQRSIINDVYENDNPDFDIADDICNGKILVLPPNLYIWATMNTSDQSLFPIDSAFKRRWEWRYIKIANGYKRDDNGDYILEDGKKVPLGWKIEINDQDWWEFIQQINIIISSMTMSADKQLGYFFCKADEQGVITKEIFVNKVLFYLWNDVFKDFADEDSSLFKYKKEPEDNEYSDMTFPDFFEEDGKVAEDVVKQFVLNVMNWKKDEQNRQDS